MCSYVRRYVRAPWGSAGVAYSVVHLSQRHSAVQQPEAAASVGVAGAAEAVAGGGVRWDGR